MRLIRGVIVLLVVATLAVASSGCGLCKKYKRGMILRGDWAVEINRTPWVGCPADVGCSGAAGSADHTCGDGCGEAKLPAHKKLLSFFNRDDNKEKRETRPGFRIACGKRRGCRSQSPCRLSPLCGSFFDMNKPNPVILTMMRNGQLPIPMEVPGLMELVVGGGTNGSTGGAGSGGNGGGNGAGGLAFFQPTPAFPSASSVFGQPQFAQNPLAQLPTSAQLATAAQQILVTPGVVLPPGGSLPAGGMVVAGGAVLRPCGMLPQCTASTPCRSHPQCGVMVPAMVAQQNAAFLASAHATSLGSGNGLGTGLYPSFIAGTGITGTGITGTGMAGIGTMGQQGSQGMVVAGGPAMTSSYATSYTAAPNEGPIGYPMMRPQDEVIDAVAQKSDAAGDNPERVPMPSPRFHSVPTRPTFQRSQGMANRDIASREADTTTSTANPAANAALQRAYIRGMYAAMQQQPSANPATGLLSGLTSAPSSLLGFFSDNKSANLQKQQQQLQMQQMLYQQQIAAMQQLAAVAPQQSQQPQHSARDTTDTESTSNTEAPIATVAHTEEPPAPAKKPAPMPKLIQQVSYLDVQ